MKRVGWMVFFAVLLCLLPTPARASDGAENRFHPPEGVPTLSGSVLPGEAAACTGSVFLPDGGGCILRLRLSENLELWTVREVTLNGERVNSAYYTVVTSYQDTGVAFAVHLAAGFAPEGGELAIAYDLTLTDSGEGFFSLEAETRDGTILAGEPGRLTSFSLDIYRAVLLSDRTGDMRPVGEACLSLYRDKKQTERVAFLPSGGNTYTACGLDCCRHTHHDYVLKTPTGGRLTLRGLSAGVYYLAENRPAEGQRECLPPVEIRLEEDGTVIADGADCTGQAVVMAGREHIGSEEREPMTLLRFYQIGSRLLALALTALVALRRYYL